MPITLLKPDVLAGVIQAIEPPDQFLGLSLLPRRTHPFPTVSYETRASVRELASFNIPNSEAHIVPKAGYGKVEHGYVYTREKKVFEPTTTFWIRQYGNPSLRARADEAIMEELRDLANRIDRRMEWSVWQMLNGQVVIDQPDVPSVVVDYTMKPSHRPVLATVDKWNYVDGSGKYTAPVRQTINAWKALVARDASSPVTDVYLSSTTYDFLMRNEEFRGANISDRQRDAFLTNNTIPGLYGMSWHVYDGGYGLNAGGWTQYIPDGVVIFVASGNTPFVMYEGPTADFDAPEGSTGRFAKSWVEPDPSGRQCLVEQNFFPALLRPDNILRALVF